MLVSARLILMLVEEPASTGSWSPYNFTGGVTPKLLISSVSHQSIPRRASEPLVLKYREIGRVAEQELVT